MASSALYNLAAMTVASTGTGTITLGSAATINGVLYLSFAAAGVPDGQPVYYSINDVGASEVGLGTYTSSGTTLTRGAVTSTNSNNAINMTSAAIVRILPIASQFREVLTGNRTYYVRTDGSNSNTGLANSAGGAFLTMQKAYDVIAANLDLAGFTVTVNVVNTSSPSTFTGGLSITQPWTGGGAVTFQGSTGTATDVVISTTSADCFATTGALPGTLTIKDMKLQTTTSGSCINHGATGLINFQNINFGAVATAAILCSKAGASVVCTGNYTISGNQAFHLICSKFAVINIQSITVTLSGTPAFASFFALVNPLGLVMIDGCTFSGASTGPRYSVANGGTIFTNGAGTTYLPGNSAGTGTNYGASPWGLYA